MTRTDDHTTDPGENTNLAGEASMAPLRAELSTMLRKGPLTGGAWYAHAHCDHPVAVPSLS
jgi:hypothetical protein